MFLKGCLFSSPYFCSFLLSLFFLILFILSNLLYFTVFHCVPFELFQASCYATANQQVTFPAQLPHNQSF